MKIHIASVHEGKKVKAFGIENCIAKEYERM